MLPKISGHAKIFDETRYLSFLIEVEQLLSNMIKSGIKSEMIFKKRFDREPVHDEKYLKTKKRFYDN